MYVHEYFLLHFLAYHMNCNVDVMAAIVKKLLIRKKGIGLCVIRICRFPLMEYSIT